MRLITHDTGTSISGNQWQSGVFAEDAVFLGARKFPGQPAIELHAEQDEKAQPTSLKFVTLAVGDVVPDNLQHVCVWLDPADGMMYQLYREGPVT